MIPTAYEMEVRIAALQAAAVAWSGQRSITFSSYDVMQTALAFEGHLKREE
jgi:hypothetical protein